MPVILRFKGYKFFFYSNEGNPLEPAHIHVRSAEGEAKFWRVPDISLGDHKDSLIFGNKLRSYMYSTLYNH